MPRTGRSAVLAALRSAPRFFLAAVLLWGGAFTGQAAAQNAKQLFDEGVQALNAGRYGEAARALDASYRAEQKPQTLYSLGLAYKGMGYPDKALQAFESYVQFADSKKDQKTVRAAKGEIQRIKTGYARFVPKLTPQNAKIEIDGQPAEVRDGELWVPIGRRKISVRAADYETYEQTLDVGAALVEPSSEATASSEHAGAAMAIRRKAKHETRMRGT
jgi:tetratricopeptide (TPR) repeat protein